MNSSPATVLFAAWAPFFSGAERALLVLTEHLDRSRYRPVVVVGTDGELAAELRARQIRTHHIPVVYLGWQRMRPWISSVGRLMAIARRERAALLHANDLPSFQPLGYAGKFLRLPTICHLRFPDRREGFEYFLRPGFTEALFISESLRHESIEAAPQLFRDHSRVIYDGVVVPPLVDDATRVELRRELGLPIDRLLVVLAGQVAEVKGLWDFLEAARVLLESGRPITFVVIGDDLKNHGALKREAEAWAQTHGCADHVRFLGFKSNVPRLMPAFDIVAVPSHVEPLGLTALEGMAASRPVVGSRVGGIAETVLDGVTGTLVPPKDSARLASAIDWLAGRPAERRAFGVAGRQRVVERFSIAAHVEGMHTIYDEMRGRSRPTNAHGVGRPS